MTGQSKTRTALLFGGWVAVAGTVTSVTVNALHPHADLSTDMLMHEVHETSYWIPLHLGIVMAQLLDMIAMLAIGRTLRRTLRADLARYADAAAITAAAVMLTLMALDGFSTKHLADYYMTTQGAEHTAAYPVAYAFLLLLLSSLGLWYLVFFGVAIPLYSLAMLRDDFYPRWIGWWGLFSGVGGLVTGALIYLLGSSFLVTTVMFLLFSTLGFAWLLACGVHLVRAANRITPDGAPFFAGVAGDDVRLER